MYILTDDQIDFIESDIRARGIHMESLQQSLLDHVCCIIERELPEGADFSRFYDTVIRTFYRNELQEIESETMLLLTFKNYYAMKNAMIISGALSVAAFILGSFFKLLHWPGASVMLVLGMVSISLVFLPLMVLFRQRGLPAQRDRLILYMGSAAGMLYCISMLFGIIHWEGSHIIWLSTLALSFFVFIPVFFFTGIRKPELRVNTMVTTIILIAATGIQFTMTALRPAPGKPLTYSSSRPGPGEPR